MTMHGGLIDLPAEFCWTRFGLHAGEDLETILARKNRERVTTGGTFLWGVGNGVGRGVGRLLELNDRPELLFSPIKSRPRSVDSRPSRVVVWLGAQSLDGRTFELPSPLRVKSHQPNGSSHPQYAFVCQSEEPLRLGNLGTLRFGALTNLLSGRALGASQVTAVVRLGSSSRIQGPDYVVAMRTQLVSPYFIRLLEPVEIEMSNHRIDLGERGAAHGHRPRLIDLPIDGVVA
jgi:hypothetical protein